MADLIQGSDSLNTGRVKLNKSIEQSERAENKSENAIKTSDEAKSIAQTAENKSDSVQEQFNQVVIDGDSSVEAAQARVDSKGQSHPTLKVRIDDFENNTNRQLDKKATKGQIVSSDLRNTTDADRLGLSNLKEEVIQAMAGTTSVNSLPANESVTIEKLAPQLQAMFVVEGSVW
ncbi:hypothetical protein [Alkalibacterium sp. MB6]|uniref:hypothetical protein n=1 Tax=Alkalibacterium sp. MB6 TaxID=2081965 RepID=UPI00137A4F0C|nr:hypothetical protein [Alkalibacterium sp. MB6]